MFFWRETTDVTSGGVPAGPTDAAAPTLDWGFTAAADEGVEWAGYGSFNLGGHVGDDARVVEANRGRLAAALDVPRDRLLFMAQQHTNEIEVVDGPRTGEPPVADGIVTSTPGIALGVLVADCVPVLLADPQAGVVAAVHAGRPGLVSGIVDRALDVMADLGAGRVRAAVGPSVCGRCYEVPAQLRDAVGAVSPLSPTVSWTGTPAVDVAAGVVDRLSRRDVAVTWVPGCTRESQRLYSYRREATTGRLAGFVRLERT